MAGLRGGMCRTGCTAGGCGNSRGVLQPSLCTPPCGGVQRRAVCERMPRAHKQLAMRAHGCCVDFHQTSRALSNAVASRCVVRARAVLTLTLSLLCQHSPEPDCMRVLSASVLHLLSGHLQQC